MLISKLACLKHLRDKAVKSQAYTFLDFDQIYGSLRVIQVDETFNPFSLEF
jgi:hypothetical protein